MKKRFYCTLFDKNYVLKGVTMLKSLEKHSNNYHVFVLCLDEFTEHIIQKLNLSHVSCIFLNNIETDELVAAKNNRTPTEYCWTLASCFTFYIFENFTEVELLTYLDADLLFFSSPEPIFGELEGASIGITEHRFSPRLKHLEVNGKYCVQWVSFRRDEDGMGCLKKWRRQCVEWCYYKLEEDRMGDQKYLDKWADEFSGVHNIKNLGAGTAPWNFDQYRISEQQGLIFIEDTPLIFYHFHQFQSYNDSSFFRLSETYKLIQNEPEPVYLIYEKFITQTLNEIRNIDSSFSYGLIEKKSYRKQHYFSLIFEKAIILGRKYLTMKNSNIN